MSDYIQLPRSALEQVHSALHLGIFLRLLEKVDDNGHLTISVRGFADEIGISYQTLRTAIEKLTANAVVNAEATQVATQRLTQITICDFENYVASSRKQQRSSQRKVNAVANAAEKPIKPSRFTPPTDEEIRAYVLEKGYHFNPEQFVPHYQSKGWKVGKEPMKDWKAACRTWEASWKEKHGEQFYYELQRATASTPRRYATQREASSQRMDDGIRAAMGVIARENGL